MIPRILVCLLTLTMALFARDPKEDGRIDSLLQKVAALEGATFIRNGSAHDPKAAVEHLRSKLKKAGDRVKTAENFIDGCATKSSLTGELYRIRFADGTEREAGKYLHEQLDLLDAKPQ